MIQSESSLIEGVPSRGAQTTQTGAATINGYEKLLAEIAQDQNHGYFDRLRKEEPNIDWLAFAGKVYKRSRSTSSITSYCQGICKFKDYLAQSNGASQDTQNLLHATIERVKKDEDEKLVYKLFDDFTTWCDNQGWRGRSTRSFVQGAKKLFIFQDVDIDHYKFKDKVDLPTFENLDDEYPDNAIIRAIKDAAPPIIGLYVQTMCDTGFDPVDIAELQVKHFHFDEDPARVTKKREKTGEQLEGFLNKETAAAIQQRIKNENLDPDDYIFIKQFTKKSVGHLRTRYNTAVARAGFGTLVKTKSGYYGKVNKIDGHKYGKYHIKVFKKRWFSLAIMTGVPEYIVQGMLGRRQYLDQYMRVPLDKKREFARKILRAVSIYRDEKDKEELLEEAGQILGLGKLTPEQARAIKETLSMFMKMPPIKRKELLQGDYEESPAAGRR